MKQFFKTSIKVNNDSINFDFKLVYYATEPKYHITFKHPDTGKNETFRVGRDSEGQWKIEAQVLPQWIHEAEMDFNDAIEDNA